MGKQSPIINSALAIHFKGVLYKIYSASSLEQYQMVISECIEELEAEGLKRMADKVNTYESKGIKNKHIAVRVWQSNDI